MKKILLIDDDRVFLKFLSTLLEKDGHQVHTVEDGIAALSLLTNFTPDVIFLDLILPRIDGDKLCRVIRRMDHLDHCHLVVVSAVVAEMKDDFNGIGADSYIAKGPFDKIASHVRAAVAAAEKPRRPEQRGVVRGLEAVSPRQLTRELLSRNRHLKTILDSMREGILEVIDGQIVYANAAASKLLGRPLEQLFAVAPPDLFESPQRERIAALLASDSCDVVGIGEKNPVEHRGRQMTVRCIPVENHTNPRIVIVADITERKRLELQLQHAQKMEAVGTIASGVAHNFRNTLTGILVNSQVIQENYPDDALLTEMVGRIDTSVKRGAQLVERLMQFARKETAREFEVIDLVTILAETYQIIKKSFESNIEIHLDIQHSLPILGDAAGLSQVFMNLFTNARDAMPLGGVLEISAARQDGTAQITVRDTGTGMEPEVAKKCFDPFFTTKEVGKGTGLGLSTTYGIVKSHDGQIQVESKLQQGTTFRLAFPILATDSSTPDIPSDICRGNGQTVLVLQRTAEVNPLEALIESIGYCPAVLQSPDQALEQYESLKPAAVLVDLEPDAGIVAEVVEQIRQNHSEARIAVLSGQSRREFDAAYPNLANAAAKVLRKPVNLYVLSTLLAEFSARSG